MEPKYSKSFQILTPCGQKKSGTWNLNLFTLRHQSLEPKIPIKHFNWSKRQGSSIFSMRYQQVHQLLNLKYLKFQLRLSSSKTKRNWAWTNS